MKKIAILVMSVLLVTILFSASPADPPKVDPNAEQIVKEEFVEGKILIKFKKGVNKSSAASKELSLANSLNETLASHGITKLERVFTNARPVIEGKVMTLPGGNKIPEPDLTLWYRTEVPADTDIPGLVAKLKSNPNIAYAEPDYIRKIVGKNATKGKGSTARNVQSGTPATVSSTPLPGSGTDPLYNQQWHLEQINAPQAWSFLKNNGYEPGGSRDVVVAVIDTGVDYTHPDLAANIWTNNREIPGNWIDDDNNGYKDDVHGANVIANTGDPMDDHGHGTHVAGIIAAEGNNNTGVVGIAYNVQVMPIKAAQSSGDISASDIADAIYYAVENGADVINMSFGGYNQSQVEKDALAVGFSRAALVAAAGNDAQINMPCFRGLNFYPAAYDWVLGVMASTPSKKLAFFSNFDCIPYDAQEYELMAPGTDIMSTLPNEAYAAWDGTSMSAPLVSGIAALVRSRYTDRNRFTSRFVMGQIAANLTCGIADAYKALTVAAKPQLSYYDNFIFDSKSVDEGNNEDGTIDSGETINLGLFVKNRWGGAKNVIVTLEARAEGAVVADQYITMITDTVDYGAVDSFCRDDNGVIFVDGKAVDVQFPFRFSVSPDAPHNHIIPFRITVTCNNNLFEGDATVYTTVSFFDIKVQKGLAVSGELTEDTTWTKNNFYIVTAPIHVPEGITLTVEPGTKIAFDDDARLVVRGNFIASGTKSQRIILTSNMVHPHSNSWDGIETFGNGDLILEYCDISYCGSSIGNWYKTLQVGKQMIVKNCVFFECYAYLAITYVNGTVTIDRNIFKNTGSYAIYIYTYSSQGTISITNNVFSMKPPRYWSSVRSIYISRAYPDGLTVTQNSFVSTPENPATKVWLEVYDTNINSQYLMAANYWGTTVKEEIEDKIKDYYDTFESAKVIYEPYLEEPSAAAPAQLASVTTNPPGKLGVGATEFTLTFNCDMNQNSSPLVAFGSSPPYTDHTITGSWTGPRTWVGTYDITPLSGDGWNVVQVFNTHDADHAMEFTNDLNHQFEIITSGTASMNLQASGGEGFVELTWTQNDFEQLAGYHLYRATSLTGYYSKINTTLVPAEQKAYTDSNVTPGQPYYYKFTVVKTDMSESNYSNVASATPLDTVVPIIYHTPITSTSAAQALTFNADITDNVAIESATLYYRVTGVVDYSTAVMTYTTGNRYSATLAGSIIVSPAMEYYIKATDGVNSVTSGRAELPYQIAVDDKPVINTITPNKGPTAGGTTVTITGSNFKSGATVTLGNAAASDVVIVNSSKITCTAPAHSAELVDVKVTNSDTLYGLLLKGYTYESGTASVSLPSASGGNGEIVEVPINAANVKGMIAADITVSFDSTVLTARTATTGNLTPVWSIVTNTATPGRIQISMANATSQTGSGVIANLEFEVVGSAGTSCDLTFDSISFNSGAIPTQTANGSYNVLQTYIISGQTRYWKNTAGIPGVEVKVDGNRLYKDTSAEDGTYEVTGIENGNYTVTASKDDDYDSISAYDASLALQHAAGKNILGSYAAVAADVNKSGAVDSMDASYILQRAVGLTGLPFTGAGEIWTFNPETVSYYNLSTDRGNVIFTGILLGDISGDWTAVSGSQPVTLEGNAQISTHYQYDADNAILTVKVMLAPQGSSIYSLDFVINYDDTKGQIATVEKGSATASWLLESNLDTAGQVLSAGAADDPLTEAGELLVLTFQLSGTDTNIGLELTKSNLNEGQVAAQVKPVITGQVTDDEGAALSGVTLTFSNSGGTAVTDADGNYSQAITTDWSGTAVPSKTGYTFTPENTAYENVIADQTAQNYTGGILVVSISVTSPENGAEWERGTTQEITWLSSNLTGDVTIDLYNEAEFHSQIGTAAVDTGRFSWEIPADSVEDADYQVRVYQGDVEAYSSGTFAILQAGFDRNANPDFNGDGKPDILWRNLTTGQNFVWYMDGKQKIGHKAFTITRDLSWEVAGTGDFDNDGNPDILWRNYANGQNVIWYMNGVNKVKYEYMTKVSDPNWQIAATGDFNDDGKCDVLWRNYSNGKNIIWYMNGAKLTDYLWLKTLSDLEWRIVAAADFNGDNQPDILWKNYNTGHLAVWYMSGGTRTGAKTLTKVKDLGWRVKGTGDYNGDGNTDILWRHHVSGKNAVWYMNGGTYTGSVWLTTLADLSWEICNNGEDKSENAADAADTAQSTTTGYNDSQMEYPEGPGDEDTMKYQLVEEKDDTPQEIPETSANTEVEVPVKNRN